MPQLYLRLMRLLSTLLLRLSPLVSWWLGLTFRVSFHDTMSFIFTSMLSRALLRLLSLRCRDISLRLFSIWELAPLLMLLLPHVSRRCAAAFLAMRRWEGWRRVMLFDAPCACRHAASRFLGLFSPCLCQFSQLMPLPPFSLRHCCSAFDADVSASFLAFQIFSAVEALQPHFIDIFSAMLTMPPISFLLRAFADWCWGRCHAASLRLCLRHYFCQRCFRHCWWCWCLFSLSDDAIFRCRELFTPWCWCAQADNDAFILPPLIFALFRGQIFRQIFAISPCAIFSLLFELQLRCMPMRAFAAAADFALSFDVAAALRHWCRWCRQPAFEFSRFSPGFLFSAAAMLMPAFLLLLFLYLCFCLLRFWVRWCLRRRQCCFEAFADDAGASLSADISCRDFDFLIMMAPRFLLLLLASFCFRCARRCHCGALLRFIRWCFSFSIYTDISFIFRHADIFYAWLIFWWFLLETFLHFSSSYFHFSVFIFLFVIVYFDDGAACFRLSASLRGFRAP